MGVLVIFGELRDILTGDIAAAFDDELDLSLIFLDESFAKCLTKLLKEEEGGGPDVQAHIFVAGKVHSSIDEDWQMWAQDFLNFKEVSKCLKDRLDKVFLANIDGRKDERNKLWVLLENFDTVASLSQVVNGFDSEALECGMVGLKVLLDDRVELFVVCADVGGAEVLDHD